jgi:hypothetical protein
MAKNTDRKTTPTPGELDTSGWRDDELLAGAQREMGVDEDRLPQRPILDQLHQERKTGQ